MKTQKYSYVIKHDTCSPELLEINVEQKNKNDLVEIDIHCESDAQATIIEKIKAESELNLKVNIIIEKNGKIIYGANQNFSPELSVSAQRQVSVKQDGEIKLFDFQQGAKESRSAVSITLLESGARGSIYGIFEGKASQVYDIIHEVFHQAPNTNSEMLTKGILDDFAKTNYRGLINMNNKASSSVGYQREDCLLLSSNSKINSVPNLEIGQGDVKCSHGVTISRMDPEKLFYLNSRGLDGQNAKEAMVMAHLAPILKQLPHPMFKARMTSSNI